MPPKKLTDKESLFIKEIVTEMKKEVTVIVSLAVRKDMNDIARDIRLHFSNKIDQEISRIDTTLRAMKKVSPSKKTRDDIVKQVVVIGAGALIISIMPAFFKFIARALAP